MALAAMKGPSKADLAREYLARKRARTDFSAFIDYMSGTWYHQGAHHRLIAHWLTKLAKGEKWNSPSGPRVCDRLMIFAPPRHGKSEEVSVHFPGFFLGMYPTFDVIQCSYSWELARDFGRQVRNLMKDPSYKLLFPDSTLAADALASDNFVTKSGGAYRAAGFQGSITGRGAHCFIVDDPIKGREQADSIGERNRIWDFYRSVARTRLEPGGRIVVIVTRWHEDDLTARILQLAIEGEWKVLELPAIRPRSRALWPQRFSYDDLIRIRRDVGEREWQALFMQNPRPWFNEGALWSRGLVDNSRVPGVEGAIKRTVVAVDPPALSGETGGEAGIVVASITDEDIAYIRHDASGKMSPEKWARTVARVSKSFDADCVVIEENQGGDMCEAVLNSVRDNLDPSIETMPRIKRVRAYKGKLLRAEPVLSRFEQSQVKIVGHWENLEQQMCTWVPTGKVPSPDRLDAMVYAVTELHGIMQANVYDVSMLGMNRQSLWREPR